MLRNLILILYYLQHVPVLSKHPQGDKIQGNKYKCKIILEIVTYIFLYTQSIMALNIACFHH